MASGRVGVLVAHAPARHPRETVDMALAFALVDRPVAAFFTGEGPLHLIAEPVSEALGVAPAHVLWRQVCEFGGRLYACAGALRALELSGGELEPVPEILEPRDLQAALMECVSICNG